MVRKLYLRKGFFLKKKKEQKKNDEIKEFHSDLIFI